MDYLRQQFCKTLCGVPNSGYIETFRVGGVLCRALISKHGEVISTLDCWKVQEDHPSYEETNEFVTVNGEIHTPYSRYKDIRKEISQAVPDDYPYLKRFEVKYD